MSQGLTFLDKAVDPKNPTPKKEERETVTFGEGLVDSGTHDKDERALGILLSNGTSVKWETIHSLEWGWSSLTCCC